ncbi:hypothetical protein OOZ19_26920 [Saccharopolyspora sp. NFXS83]|uniref:hypothetical protein n=1 Tax=Saccharopolyspora sp. NFXS83 TaxID=2993560 RepID=UPI00224B67CB|nr:hypothetical protein [Saccharopolyspora sp. NFXS83]MCX2733893.1 hypothetical protein [Saccharopolyspora sp. NFXS83]
MDPRDRADETLARARARGAFVVTPDNATSPMDASTTVRIPRTVVAAADQAPADADSTMAIPQPATRPQERPEQRPQPQSGQQQAGQQQAQQPSGQQQSSQQQNDGYSWPAEDYGQLPPNPYQAQRSAGQFGPLGSRAARNQQY